MLNTRCKDKLYDYLLELNHDEQHNKYEKWLGAIPEQGIREVPDRETILLNFKETDEPVSGVLWLKTKKRGVLCFYTFGCPYSLIPLIIAQADKEDHC